MSGLVCIHVFWFSSASMFISSMHMYLYLYRVYNTYNDALHPCFPHIYTVHKHPCIHGVWCSVKTPSINLNNNGKSNKGRIQLTPTHSPVSARNPIQLFPNKSKHFIDCSLEMQWEFISIVSFFVYNGLDCHS